MRFKDIDYCADKIRSDHTAEVLSEAGVRIKRRALAKNERRVYVIAVHPDDVARAGSLLMKRARRESEDFVRTQPLVRRRFRAVDMLITRAPNDAGFYCSFPHRKRAFDRTQFRKIRGGWDHEHCRVCSKKIMPGDTWWACDTSDAGDQVGVCLKCRARLFGRRRRSRPT